MSKKIVLAATAIAMSVVFAATASWAGRQEPKKANKVQMTLVGAYEPCTSPNDTTTGVPLPACHLGAHV
jgi:hypothetical protein